MVYRCDFCGYITARKANFLRHKNRKNTCDKTSYEGNIKNIKICCDNNPICCDNNPICCDNNPSGYICSNCKKVLTSKRNLINHINVCEGVLNPRQCKICLKVFSTQQGKWKHTKNVKCLPSVLRSRRESSTNNITHIENQTNNTTNNTTNNNIQTQNNFQINVFGNEDMSYLSNDSNIIHRLRMYGKEGIYGLPKIIDDVHFNKERPENQTIIKPEEYGNTVLIKNDNNEWELREFEDVRDNMLDTIIKYFKAYNEVKKKQNIKLIEKKERQFIKTISYELMALDGSIPRDLFYELEMNDACVEEDETKIKNKTRKFDKCTMHTIHNRTSSCFKKENGSYVKR